MTTHPDQNAFTVSAPDRQKPNHRLNLVLGVLLTITMLSLAGPGHAIHGIAGTLLLLGCGIHIGRHRRWIQAVIEKTPKNLTPTVRRNRSLFWGMLVSGAICGLSGLATLPFAHGPGHLLLPLMFCWNGIHALSGLAFLGLNLYHLALHRHGFTKRAGESSATARK